MLTIFIMWCDEQGVACRMPHAARLLLLLGLIRFYDFDFIAATQNNVSGHKD